MKDSPFDFFDCLKPFLPDKGQAIAVAVSGGPDSMALCHALSQCAAGTVHALTVDHRLRPDAAKEARQVGKWVQGWRHVEHHILTRDLPEAEETRVQEAARHDRYRLIADYCEAQGIKQLFTAHHLNDQAETFLFRLAKGSGLDGLGAIRPVHDYSPAVQLFRPFLGLSKNALITYCHDHGVPYIDDPSNENERFARVRLRQSYEILAEEGLTPKRLAKTAERLARAREALEVLAVALFEKAVTESNASRIEFDFEMLAGQPEELRLRVLQAAIARLGGKRHYPPRLERLEELAFSVFNDSSFKRTSFAGCLIGLCAGKARLVIEREQVPPSSI